jgi:hypothetical protein
LVYKPAYNVMAHRSYRMAVFSIRGTQSFEDVLADANATAQVDVELCGVSGTCHGGMLSSARWLAEDGGVVDWMKRLHDAGFERIVFTGHSLGAGVALLLALLTKSRHPEMRDVEVFGFAMPACVDAGIADVLCGTGRGTVADGVVVRSMVNKDDIVSRLSVANAVALAREIQSRRADWEPLLSSDLDGVLQRAKTLWAPNQRRESSPLLEVEEEEEEEENGEDGRAAAGEGKAGGDGKHGDGGAGSSKSSDGDGADSSTTELVQGILHQNTPQARLVVPGSICHTYHWRGQTRCALVDHRHPSLRRIEAFSTCTRDHRSASMLSAMRGVFAARDTSRCRDPPAWECMNLESGADVCCCVCRFPVSWSLTGKAKTETARATHHCRACGRIVCKACSSGRLSLPRFGILDEQRVCDTCWSRSSFADFDDCGAPPGRWGGRASAEEGQKGVDEEAFDDSSEEEGDSAGGEEWFD